MFSSTYDGERAAAAAHADRILKSAGLTWEQLLTEPPQGSGTSRRREDALVTPGVVLARYGDSLTGWERGFLVSLLRRREPRTGRQQEVFAGIRDRVMGGAP